MSYKENRAWSDRYLPTVKRIVGPLLLGAAPVEEDCFRATDLMILAARDLRIACRVRRPGYADRYPYDFTVRCQIESGAETEMTKLVNGFGDWFFYGHAAEECLGIDRYMIVDLAAWRAHLIRRGWGDLARKSSNGDGTHFFSFDVRSFVGNPRLLIASSFAEAEAVPA